MHLSFIAVCLTLLIAKTGSLAQEAGCSGALFVRLPADYTRAVIQSGGVSEVGHRSEGACAKECLRKSSNHSTSRCHGFVRSWEDESCQLFDYGVFTKGVSSQASKASTFIQRKTLWRSRSDVALGQTASSSSVWRSDFAPGNAVDGDGASVFHSHRNASSNSWWMVELDDLHLIHGISISNRRWSTNDAVNQRFRNLQFQVAPSEDLLADPESLCAEQVEPLEPGVTKFYACNSSSTFVINQAREETPVIPGRFIRVWQTIPYEYLHFYEAVVHSFRPTN